MTTDLNQCMSIPPAQADVLRGGTSLMRKERAMTTEHVHFNVQAMNDDGDWETPLPPFMSLADARSGALDIAEDYPRGVEIHLVRVTSETVWTNKP